MSACPQKTPNLALIYSNTHVPHNVFPSEKRCYFWQPVHGWKIDLVQLLTAKVSTQIQLITRQASSSPFTIRMSMDRGPGRNSSLGWVFVYLQLLSAIFAYDKYLHPSIVFDLKIKLLLLEIFDSDSRLWKWKTKMISENLL